MAVCDITDKQINWEDGYLLTTSQVVSNPSYWEYAFSHQWAYVHNKDPEGKMLAQLIELQSAQSAGWLISEEVSHLFDFDREKAKKYAKQQAPSRPDGGPADPNKVAEAAVTAWVKVYGTVPNIKRTKSSKFTEATFIFNCIHLPNADQLASKVIKDFKEAHPDIRVEDSFEANDDSYDIKINLEILNQVHGSFLNTEFKQRLESYGLLSPDASTVFSAVPNETSEVVVNTETTFSSEADKAAEQKVSKQIPDQQTKQKLNEELLKAAKEGNTSTIEALLQQGADVNAADKNDNTTLMIAAMEGHVKIVKLLLKQMADMEAVNIDGFTALIWAAMKGKVNVVKVLLQQGSNINTSSFLGTALGAAGLYGQVNVVEVLLQYEADVNATCKRGNTALLIAAMEGNADVVELLLNHGGEAKTSEHMNSIDLICATAVIEAVQVKLPGKERRNSGKRWKFINKLLGRNKKLNSALLEVVRERVIRNRKGISTIVKALISQGADVNATDTMGFSALTGAAYYGNVDLVEVLLQQGGNVNVIGNWVSKSTMKRNNKNIYKHIDIGREFNVPKVFMDFTALMYAASRGHADVVRLFLNNGVKVNATNTEGMTALMLAAENGYAEVVELLLNQGADVNVVDNYGNTALMFASHNEHVDVVKTINANS